MMMRRAILAAFSMMLLCPTAWALGPRNVTSGGKAVKWPSMPVRLDLESDLSVRGKDVGPLVDEALSQWEGVTEANVGFDLHDLGTPVDDNCPSSTCVCNFFFDSLSCPDETNLEDCTNPLVIDEDGTIVAD